MESGRDYMGHFKIRGNACRRFGGFAVQPIPSCQPRSVSGGEIRGQTMKGPWNYRRSIDKSKRASPAAYYLPAWPIVNSAFMRAMKSDCRGCQTRAGPEGKSSTRQSHRLQGGARDKPLPNTTHRISEKKTLRCLLNPRPSPSNRRVPGTERSASQRGVGQQDSTLPGQQKRLRS
jgi:hypothetical protein